MSPGPRAESRGAALPEVVLVSNGELGSGAYESHVLGLARWLSPHALVHHVALASPRYFGSPEGRALVARSEERARSLLSGEVRVLPHSPRQQLFSLDAWTLTRAVLELKRGDAPILLHCRAALATMAAAAGPKRRLPLSVVLHDARGAIEHEASAHGGTFAPDQVHWLEEQACRLADATIAVSDELGRYLALRHGTRTAGTFPCAADTRRFRPDAAARAAKRRELGWEGNWVLGFVGGLAGWQRPDALASLARVLREERADARLLVVTPQAGAYAKALAAGGLEPGSYRVVSAHPDEVPAWLAACDATALLRDRDVVNSVASPIKMGESLAVGVPVLVTEGLGDVSGIVKREGLGATFEDLFLRGECDRQRLRDFLREQAGGGEAMAARCRRFAESSWSWDEQVPRLLALYGSLLGRPKTEAS